MKLCGVLVQQIGIAVQNRLSGDREFRVAVPPVRVSRISGQPGAMRRRRACSGAVTGRAMPYG